jgi:hypothetical protein
MEAGVGKQEAVALATQEEVGGHVEVLAQGQVLPDHGDAASRRGRRIRR